MYTTVNTSFTISEVPAGTEEGWIDVVAVNGANPFYELEPNLELHNGYFFARRFAVNYLNFEPTLGKRSTPENTTFMKPENMNKRVDHYILSQLAQSIPQLEKHIDDMCNSKQIK